MLCSCFGSFNLSFIGFSSPKISRIQIKPPQILKKSLKSQGQSKDFPVATKSRECTESKEQNSLSTDNTSGCLSHYLSHVVSQRRRWGDNDLFVLGEDEHIICQRRRVVNASPKGTALFKHLSTKIKNADVLDCSGLQEEQLAILSGSSSRIYCLGEPNLNSSYKSQEAKKFEEFKARNVPIDLALLDLRTLTLEEENSIAFKLIKEAHEISSNMMFLLSEVSSLDKIVNILNILQEKKREQGKCFNILVDEVYTKDFSDLSGLIVQFGLTGIQQKKEKEVICQWFFPDIAFARFRESTDSLFKNHGTKFMLKAIRELELTPEIQEKRGLAKEELMVSHLRSLQMEADFQDEQLRKQALVSSKGASSKMEELPGDVFSQKHAFQREKGQRFMQEARILKAKRPRSMDHTTMSMRKQSPDERDEHLEDFAAIMQAKSDEVWENPTGEATETCAKEEYSDYSFSSAFCREFEPSLNPSRKDSLSETWN